MSDDKTDVQVDDAALQALIESIPRDRRHGAS